MKYIKNILLLVGIVVIIQSLLSCQPKTGVKTGLDVLEEQHFAIFAGKRVGIICNHTAYDKNGRHIVDLFHDSGVCTVTAIFGPEHGFRGEHADGGTITDERDPKTGAIIYSLYGSVRQPTDDMLKEVDVLVYDIQDVGARFYTYISTLSLAMESAAKLNIPFFVLDRPNPIRGDRCDGPILDTNFASFVGPHPIPIRYGMTIGELAQWINSEIFNNNDTHVDLTIVKASGWNRSDWYDQTGLAWISPSPNMTTLETAIAYPGFCLLEGTNLSEGRGTDAPFLKFGAPWIEPTKYANALNQLNLPGIVFKPISFTPVSIPGVALRPKYENQLCGGVVLEISDREVFEPISAMLYVLEKSRDLYPDEFNTRDTINRLYGSDLLLKALSNKIPVQKLIDDWRAELENFKKSSQKYYLY